MAFGKTVVGKLLASRLGYRFLDTGLMYRAITWLALKENIALEDSPLTELAQQSRIQVINDDHENTRIIVNDTDATSELRGRDVEQVVSVVSKVAGLREVMVEHQRDIAREGSIVMVGRDIGTIVLPEAKLKVFLRASVGERARRRHSELQEMGKETSHDAILDNLEERDRIDSHRIHAPLHPAEDAHLLDTDDIGVEEVVERIMAMVNGSRE